MAAGWGPHVHATSAAPPLYWGPGQVAQTCTRPQGAHRTLEAGPAWAHGFPSQLDPLRQPLRRALQKSDRMFMHVYPCAPRMRLQQGSAAGLTPPPSPRRRTSPLATWWCEVVHSSCTDGYVMGRGSSATSPAQMCDCPPAAPVNSSSRGARRLLQVRADASRDHFARVQCAVNRDGAHLCNHGL